MKINLNKKYRKISSKILEIHAKILSKRFFCRSLAGKSLYNLSINSDLTVSCNCNDCYGEGKIGDLNKQSLKEIFYKGKSDQFRNKLSKGELPISNCISCKDLRLIDKKNSEKSLTKVQIPRNLLIENTINCNLNCLSCNRKKLKGLREKTDISLDEFKKISKELKENKIKRIFYFNLGEPFISNAIKKELKIIKKDNPKIEIIISTNGTLLNTKEKREAALLTNKIIFSIDGSTQKSLKKYQVGGNFKESYGNMKELVKFRNSKKMQKPTIQWKYVLFRWNDSKKLVQRAIKLAKNAKIDELAFYKTTSPLSGTSYRYYLGLGYLNKIKNFKGKKLIIKLNENQK